MLERLISFIPLGIIGVMVSAKRILTANELEIQESFWRKLDTGKTFTRKTKKPLIVAIVGLVGSGKSTVSRELAKHINATVVENDAIRIELRKNDESYDRVWAIAENIAAEVVRLGGNVVLDSDFVDAKKRASLREKARSVGAVVVFVRTYCDFDVASKRIRENDPGEFFNDALSKSDAPDKGKDVKMRELLRRAPLHYRWVDQSIGKWVLKKLPFATFAEIDTSDYLVWKMDTKDCAIKLLMKYR